MLLPLNKNHLILRSEFAESVQGGRMLNNASQGAENNDHLGWEIARKKVCSLVKIIFQVYGR